MRKLALTVVLALLIPAAIVAAKASHAGWPHIDGRLVINSRDANETIRGLPDKHNELLGGNGDDTIDGGNVGDVLWGDYKPSGQPAAQSDTVHAGAGNDFIYTSHGTNRIWTGGGRDVVHAHFGRGEIHCQSATVTVFVSHRSRRAYRLFGCRHVAIG